MFIDLLEHNCVSITQCKFHLRHLAKMGLVAYNLDDVTFRVTTKGDHIMQIYTALLHQLGEDVEL